MDYNSLSLQKHEQYKGKYATSSKVPLDTKDDLATYYSPWVAAPCLAIEKDPELAYKYTSKNNTVAVISDWSAVLGLWNIGGIAGLPVMEWKAILFKHFGNVDAIPIVLNTQNVEEIISTIKHISPSFGWINLEDIKAPECFEIEERLIAELDIPVFHDDQHGTAIVTLAAIINSLKLTWKNITDCKIVLSWAWAAGIAITNLLAHYWATHIIAFDSRGPIYKWRDGLNTYKEKVAFLNKNNETGTLSEIMVWADIFIGISQPNLLTPLDIQNMAQKPIVFAMANPDPEITRDEAQKWWVYIMWTGRSDYPNQVNNVLAFPWLFRGVLDAGIKTITNKHKIAAAEAIAAFVTDINPKKVVPSALDLWVASAVANAVVNVGT